MKYQVTMDVVFRVAVTVDAGEPLLATTSMLQRRAEAAAKKLGEHYRLNDEDGDAPERVTIFHVEEMPRNAPVTPATWATPTPKSLPIGYNYRRRPGE